MLHTTIRITFTTAQQEITAHAIQQLSEFETLAAVKDCCQRLQKQNQGTLMIRYTVDMQELHIMLTAIEEYIDKQKDSHPEDTLHIYYDTHEYLLKHMKNLQAVTSNLIELHKVYFQ